MPKKRKAAKRKKTAVATADLPAKDNGNEDGRAPPLPEEIKEHDGGYTATSSSASSSPGEHHCSRPAEEFSGSETVAFDGSTEGVALVQNDEEEESSIVVKEATFSSATESSPKSKDSIVEATKYQEEHEEAVDESAVPVEKIVVLAEEERQVDEIALAEVQVKVVLLPDADETAKQLNESHGDRRCGGRDETLPTAELTLPTPVVVVGRTSWWSCCGLFDVFAGSG